MTIKNYSFLVIALCITYASIGQNRDNVIGSFPFTITPQNNIAVKAILNQKDTINLMLHTAAESLTLIEKSTASISSINWNKEETVESWGGKSTARYSKNNTLQIGSFKWKNLPIWENKNSGPGTDGKFGPNLFKNQVIEISVTKGLITIYNELPKKRKGYKKIPLSYRDGFMFINGTSTIASKKYKNEFLIHSGYAGFILYDDAFANKNKLDTQLKITDTKELKDSYGNILKTQKANLPLFAIGKVNFKNVPVGFFKGSIARQNVSVIGTDVLKRFDFFIDKNRTFIYLKPNANFNATYNN